MRLGKIERILYVFGGEKAQGAEIVIDRLMSYNHKTIEAHLILSEGHFADSLRVAGRPYPITTNPHLKKLNRRNSSALMFYLMAIRNYFSISFSVYKYILKNNIQAVHANTVVPASYLIPLLLFCHLFRRDLLWIWSDHDMTNFSGLDRFLSNQCTRLYDHTLVVSKVVNKKYGKRKRVSVLYNGLDVEEFKCDNVKRRVFRGKYGFQEDQVLIGIPAVVAPRKGQLELIHAFNLLCKEFDNIHLLLAGGYESASPKYCEDVKGAIDDNQFIKHLGYINDMTNFYNGCDIIVNNSDIHGSEPLGTTIYEAMCCEKIVVASDTGGTKEIITKDEDGFLFEAENLTQLQEQLKYVISNINSLDSLKYSARRKVVQKFNISGMAEQYNTLIIQRQKAGSHNL